MKTLIADVETDNLLPALTTLHCLAIGDPETKQIEVYADAPGYKPLKEGMVLLSQADRVVFHNGLNFDLWAVNRFYPGTIRFEQMYDTLVVARLLEPERKHNLELWGERLGVPKVEFEAFDRFSDEMAHRCKIDVLITMKLYTALQEQTSGWEQAVELEHRVALVIALQEQNGFRLDVPAALKLESELRQEQAEVERALQEVFPPIWVGRKAESSGYVFPSVALDELKLCVKTPKVGTVAGKGLYVAGCPYTKVELLAFNPGSRQQIEARLRAKGWVPAKYTETGAAQLDETILNDLAFQYAEAKELARYFRLTKQLGQLADGDNAWLKLYRGEHPDARVHGGVNPNGAVTGRMTHFNPNMGQVDKKDLRMREVWVAGRGRKLVGCDAEGLELRALGHYLAYFGDGGAFARSVVEGDKAKGTDPHSINQRLLSLFNRDNAKRFIYALIYGAGDPKLGLILVQDAIEADKYNPDDAPHLFARTKRGLIRKRDLKGLGAEGRAKMLTGIVGFDRLVEGCRRRHRKYGYLTGLDGRKLFTRSQHSALNTLLQGAGAVIMKKALAIFHFERATALGLVSPDFYRTSGFWYAANVHDEVQLEAAPKLADTVGREFAQSIADAGVAFNFNCPLAGDYAIGDNWKETH